MRESLIELSLKSLIFQLLIQFNFSEVFMASISTFKRVLFLAEKYPIPALSMKDGLLRLQLRLGRPLDYRRGVKWN